MNKVLITGGSGFLGSHVADTLSHHGYDVSILDRSASPYLLTNQKMIVADILDKDEMERIVPQFDTVYHFAGMADIGHCLANPIAAVKVNIEATVILLDILKNHPVKRFVYASTAYVYSESGGIYRVTKQAAESFLHLYHQLYQIPYTILRFGSLYGTRSDQNNAIYKFLKQALYDNKIEYKGTGEEVRQFIHVKDAAQACVNILSDEFKNQEILLSGPDRMQYKELFLMIKEILGNKIAIDYKVADTDNNHYFITPYNFNPKLGKKYLVNPFIDLGQGLLELIEDLYKNK